MGLLIEGYCTSPALRGEVLHDLPLTGCFVHYRESAVSVGTECITGARIEGSAVGSLTDGRRRQDSSGVGIGDGHESVTADGKQPAILGVDGDDPTVIRADVAGAAPGQTEKMQPQDGREDALLLKMALFMGLGEPRAAHGWSRDASEAGEST